MIDLFLTGLFYVFLYGIVILLFWLADMSKKESNKKILIVIAVIIASLFASLRNTEVGSDTSNTIALYMDSIYARVPLHTLMGELLGNSNEVIYYIIANIITKIGLGNKVFLFIMEVLIICPISLCAYKLRKRVLMSATMTFYFLLYYQLGFNWIRQSIAASFLLLAIIFLNEKKYVNVVAIAFLSVVFHSSAIIGLLLFGIAYICSRIENKNKRRMIIIMTIIIAFFVMKNWQLIGQTLIEKGILPMSYAGYINVFSGAHGTTYKGWFVVGLKAYVEYGLRILFLVLPSVMFHKINFKYQRKDEFYFYRMCVMLSVLVYSAALIGLHTAYGNRIVYYMDYVNILLLGCCYPKRKHMKTLFKIGMVLLCVMYNIWLYYVLGWHDTVPFYFV